MSVGNTIKRHRELSRIKEVIHCVCPWCSSENTRIIGEVDNELTVRCQDCGMFFEEERFGEETS